MLRSVEKLKGFRIQATDGEIGKVDELFFSERRWQVRYLVVDVGSWLLGRRVLIAPTAVTRIDVDAQKVFLSLTKDRIENSPDVATDEPISREKERKLHEYYQWQPYWVSGVYAPSIYGTFPSALVEMPTVAPIPPEEQDQEADEKPNLRSTAEVTGYRIQAEDGEIGHVTDFLFDDGEWNIRHLVVDTGTWLSGRKVLVAPPWIQSIHWAGSKVNVALTQESVRQSPPFEPGLLNIEKYETQLLEHYKAWFSHLLEEDRKRGETSMFLGKDVMGNPVISVDDGRAIGKVKDIYLTHDCQNVAGIYLGSEGLFSRRSFLVKSQDVVTIGPDAVLVKHADVVQEKKDMAETETEWLRRDELQGRPVDTPGGTKVGKVGDVIINKDGDVTGFSLDRVYVSGPIADNRAVALHTIQDVGHEDGGMTIDLERAEQQELTVA